ncbi:MAG TPA: SUMF1/EgtB/PvdO family nonheme iron enzyme [Pirellulaceae bacterium]|nr:SUMF1/EgtB/PvdO family nonheme iron enzyme [Pirellulaceae bacterium]
MRLSLKNLNFNWLCLGAVPVCLLLGWATGYWMLGAGGAAAALCVLAIRQPQFPWRLVRQSARPKPVEEPESPLPPRKAVRRGGDGSLVDRMVASNRVPLLLRPQIASSLGPSDLAAAQAALDETMAIVPQGPVAVRARCYESLDEEHAPRAERLIQVEGFFLDRFTVTNQEFQQFVEEGGYEQMALWDESIWPAVLGFVDRTGHPGPRYWENGCYPRGTEDHPVVGVSWYEASAYSRWTGKRLPTDPEWVKAGGWPVMSECGRPVQRKFPWGDAMDRRRANMWGSGWDGTVAVHALPEGVSVGGVQQLIGNVWEWTSSTFGAWEPSNRKIETHLPLKSIRGGAFDTYFDTQANCQFQSGESPLSRKHNVGFRCALGFCDVVHMADSVDADATDELPGIPAGEEVHA